MALNTLKCSHPTQLLLKGLMAISQVCLCQSEIPTGLHGNVITVGIWNGIFSRKDAFL